MKKIQNAKRSFRALNYSHDMVRKTALNYLKEAILTEKYESCASLIATAKEFGASDGQIQSVLEDPRRVPE